MPSAWWVCTTVLGTGLRSDSMLGCCWKNSIYCSLTLTVSPLIHQLDLFVLPLRSFWLSHVLTWKVLVHDPFKVLVHDPFNTRLHLFGIRCHWTPASPRPCQLLSLNSKHTSSSPPFHKLAVLFSNVLCLLGKQRVVELVLMYHTFQCVCGVCSSVAVFM